ncbi:AEC family transporter [Paenibacillus cisolokensis]|jgi:predicted permease|uniref:Transporter n=1 Tax=Paenibacillus cisolokensis TaxID=1658519 RepID=A0ABQ4NFN1_9BACL|nr:MULTISPECIES: AEC family transporter [Paenibacillus]ALS26721.1 transporter [Paenibacillus sp. 32O-W]GIQ67062.1 transporter [Paenibacillus cisolokensis]
MTILLHILWNNVLPLSVMVAIGVILQRAFSLDIRTLSKLNFYLFSPSIIFDLLYTTDISGQLVARVLMFFAVFMALQYAVVELAVRGLGLNSGMRSAMRNSVLFYNSANYGIPLNQLAFAGNPYTLSIQVLIMMMQALVPNTYGVYSVNAHKSNFRNIMRQIMTMPIIYVIPLAFALRGFSVELPGFIMTPIGYLSDAFIGTALITLGVQLGSMKWQLGGKLLKLVLTSNALRLAVGPLLAALVVWLLGIDGLMGAALIVSSAVPTSLSSVLLAVEFDNEPEFSSQAVFMSTLLSVVTVTVVIYLLQIQG